MYSPQTLNWNIINFRMCKYCFGWCLFKCKIKHWIVYWFSFPHFFSVAKTRILSLLGCLIIWNIIYHFFYFCLAKNSFWQNRIGMAIVIIFLFSLVILVYCSNVLGVNLRYDLKWALQKLWNVYTPWLEYLFRLFHFYLDSGNSTISRNFIINYNYCSKYPSFYNVR